MLFPLGHIYPYTDLHDLNLDWILQKVKEVEKEVDDFVAFNKVTFRGTWNGDPYPAWTVVDDGSGNGFLAIQAVPANVPLTDTAYWTPVAAYATIYSAFNSRITALESGYSALLARTVNGHPLSANVTVDATEVPYSGTLSSNNVKDAIDELHAANDALFDNNGLYMKARVRNGVVTVTTVSGTLSAAVQNGAVLITIPNGFHSFDTIEALDSAGRRYLIATNGQIIPTEDLAAGTAVRLSMTYLT